MTLGQKIKNVRKNAGYTQSEFAELLSSETYKIGNTTVSNWEKDLNKPDIETISNICYKLNIPASYFIEPKTPKKELNSVELSLVNNFQQLNESGQSKLMERLDELLELPKYRKEWQTFVLCLYYRTTVLICQ